MRVHPGIFGLPALAHYLNMFTHRFLVFSLSLALWAAAFSVAAQAPSDGGPAGKSNLDSYRKYALTHEGDVARGASLFADEQRLGCAKCHSVDGGAGRAGPDLFAAGDKFGRRDLVEAVLVPSAVISPGYGTVIVETKAGGEHQGILKRSDAGGVQLMGADGGLVSIAAADILAQRGSSVSLMPEGLEAGLTPSEFTDVIEYLASLKQPESTLASHRGMPVVIPEIANPVAVTPFFSQALKLPRGKQQTGLTALHQIPGLPNVFLVLHQKGMIWKMEKTAAGEEKSVFADLTGEVFSDRGPNGLLDMTFHPKVRENRKYYLKYQVFEDGKVCTLVVEKKFAADFKSDSGEPPRRIIKFVSVAEDHSGGCLRFGPDGFLYIVMGDTGPHNDPNGHAQNLELLLGKLLRIDVDHAGDGLAYAIPKDNPFLGRAGARPEIWAYGFRNPWRFTFDRVTGDLWLADADRIAWRRWTSFIGARTTAGMSMKDSNPSRTSTGRKAARSRRRCSPTGASMASPSRAGWSAGPTGTRPSTASMSAVTTCPGASSAWRRRTACSRRRGRSELCPRDWFPSARTRPAMSMRSGMKAWFTRSISPARGSMF